MERNYRSGREVDFYPPTCDIRHFNITKQYKSVKIK